MRQEENTNPKRATSSTKRKIVEALSIGIWGAVIWSVFGYICYWLNLAKVSPAHISKVIIKESMMFQWQGLLISILLLICLSIIFSLIYVFIFSHIFTPWIGIIFGCIIWYAMLGWRKLDINTIASTISLFILYGAFIGYSLSIEFSSLEKKE